MLSNIEIANRLVELCRKADYGTTYQELFHPTSIKSIEPEGVPNRIIEGGIEVIAQKGQQFFATVQELHSSSISDPVIAGNHFSISWKVEVTFKGEDKPATLEEIIVYEIKDGRIISEQFFFTPKETHLKFQNQATF